MIGSTAAASVGSRVLREIEETTLDEVRGGLSANNLTIAMTGSLKRLGG